MKIDFEKAVKLKATHILFEMMAFKKLPDCLLLKISTRNVVSNVFEELKLAFRYILTNFDSDIFSMYS